MMVCVPPLLKSPVSKLKSDELSSEAIFAAKPPGTAPPLIKAVPLPVTDAVKVSPTSRSETLRLPLPLSTCALASAAYVNVAGLVTDVMEGVSLVPVMVTMTCWSVDSAVPVVPASRSWML